jgi:UPF0716 family protein affecting phage T7 exclusion
MRNSFRSLNLTQPFSWLITALYAAILLAVLTLPGFESALIGWVLVIPMLGHAGGYALWDLLDASAVPVRELR